MSFDKNSKPQKFFERYLNNDLKEVTQDLNFEYIRIATGKMFGVKPLDDQKDIFSYTKSYSTQKSREYNAFQMYYPWMHELYSAVVDMVREACEYYEVDYNSEQWMCQAWFNINSNDEGKMLGWHDHVHQDFDKPAFHGYYSVNAEPSQTFYNINGDIIANNNKNNRAVLSMVGFPHAMGPWESDEKRITIAYDILPLSKLLQKSFINANLPKEESFWEQHYFPLPKINS